MDTFTVVFDFDKTLTYNDTLLDFYKMSTSKTLTYPLKRFIYFCVMVLHKLKLISNNSLKHIGVILFLKNLTLEQIDTASTFYYSQIKFNKLYRQFNFNDPRKKIIVISGSFECYLKKIFPPNVMVLASQIEFKNNKVCGVKINCFGSQKATILADNGVYKINRLYTDSYFDYQLAEISNEIIIVKNDEYKTCNNLNEFKEYFRK